MNGMSSAKSILSEKHKDYLSLLAYIYVKNNQLTKAIVVYKALWHLYPEMEQMPFCLSYLYLKIHDSESALFYADIYLSQKNNGLGFLLKSQAHALLGQTAEAREAIRNYSLARTGKAI